MHCLNTSDLLNWLRNEEIVSGERIEQCLQKTNQEDSFSVYRALCETNEIDEIMFAKQVAEHFGIPFLRARDYTSDNDRIGVLNANFATHYHVFPAGESDGILLLACSDPFNKPKLDDLRMLLGQPFTLALSPKADIDENIRKHYGVGAKTVEKIISKQQEIVLDEDTHDLHEQEKSLLEQGDETSIAHYVKLLITDAIEGQATDIHIEPHDHMLRIRFRIDGVLVIIPTPEELYAFQSSIVSRIKVMAGMDIAEKRLPQDGRIQVVVHHAS